MNNWIPELLTRPDFWASTIGYYLFSCGVSAMDSPMDREKRGEAVSAAYRWWFKFLNLIAANWSRARINGKTLPENCPYVVDKEKRDE